MSFPLPLGKEEKSALAQARTRAERHTTVLLAAQLYPDTRRAKDADQVGTGTFVRVGDTFGVLTAEHVSRNFQPPFALGFMLDEERKVQAPVIQDFAYQVHVLGKAPNCEGPDLGFIQLFDPDVGTVRAFKTFYDLSSEREAPRPDLRAGFWLVAGSPVERGNMEGPQVGHERVLATEVIFGASGPPREEERAGLDYYWLDVDYNVGVNLPVSFVGFSGGGVWQLSYFEDAEEGLVVTTHLLSGVVICEETETVDGRKRVLCHGRRSVLDFACSRIEELCGRGR